MADVTIQAVGVLATTQLGVSSEAPANPWIANLSFEDAGSDFGIAARWAWNRYVSFRFAHFARVTGWTRREEFEFHWGVDAFVSALVVPTNARTLTFGGLGRTPAHEESFERQWGRLLPAIPSPPWLTTEGNETAFFVWDEGRVSADADLLDPFEAHWHSNEAYLWSFAPASLLVAAFGASAFEPFETDWKENDTYEFHATDGHWTVAVFKQWVTDSYGVEDFSAVAPDQPITFAPSTTIQAPGAILPTPAPLAGYPTNIHATFYNAGGVGALPPEIDPRRTYFIRVPLPGTVGTFEISTTEAGSALAFSGGSGNNFFKSDRSRFWTLTDVGI